MQTPVMIEWIGSICTLIAVSGVVLNNYKLRLCFIFWLCSNLATGLIHIYLGIYSLAVRDFVFFVLAIHGFYVWSKEK
jgi:nicotinamide riboside transporter PnuC